MKKSRIRLPKEQLEKFAASCRNCGIKVTHQRLEIFREIAPAADHPSAEDIYNRVKIRIPTISLDTVYRTLALFEQCKIISRVHPLDDRSRFDPNTNTHHHFICVQCKKVCDFYWPDFDRFHLPQETEEYGVIQSKTVELWGICRDCLKTAKK
ncbi:MAG: transcriptional repressor [Candidatus Omnitrophota bacterium]